VRPSRPLSRFGGPCGLRRRASAAFIMERAVNSHRALGPAKPPPYSPRRRTAIRTAPAAVAVASRPDVPCAACIRGLAPESPRLLTALGWVCAPTCAVIATAWLAQEPAADWPLARLRKLARTLAALDAARPLNQDPHARERIR
jgi:hypothetical protein